MALIFADDGEGGYGSWGWTSSNNTTQEGSPHDGGRTIGQTNGLFYAKRTLLATETEIYISVFCKIGGLNNARLVSWWSGSTELGSIRWNLTSKKFEIYTGTATLQVTGTVVQQDTGNGGGWFNLNIRVLLHDSTGIIDLRHEGATSSDAIFNGDTLPSGTTLDSIQVGDALNGHFHGFDNFWLNDTSGSLNNGWPGVVRCSTQFPTGKSATNDAWTADSGTNKYDRINEQPVSAAQYIYSPTTGQKQGFTYAAPVFTGVVKAVMFSDTVQKISTGGIKQGLRISGTDYPGSTLVLPTAFVVGSKFHHYAEQNPNGPAAWTSSDNPESYLEKTA